MNKKKNYSFFSFSKDHTQNVPVISILNIGLVRLGITLGFLILMSQKLFLPALLTLFLLITTEGSRLWSVYSFKRLSAQLIIHPVRSFPEEELQFRLTWHNDKRLPILIQWQQGLPFSNQELPSVDSAFIKGKASYERTYTFKASRRGCYSLPPLSVTAWDGLGLFATKAQLFEEHSLLVYPRLVPLPDFHLQSADFIGPQADKRPFLLDPVRISGLRAYTPDMPSRLINWKLSAQKGQLLAKVLETSSDLRLCIAVDSSAFFPQAEEEFEAALSLAATLVSYADEHKIPFGFMTDAPRQGFLGSTRVPISISSTQASIVLESLARLEFKSEGALNQLFREEGNNLPWGTTLIALGNGSSFTLPREVRSVIWHCVTPQSKLKLSQEG